MKWSWEPARTPEIRVSAPFDGRIILCIAVMGLPANGEATRCRGPRITGPSRPTSVSRTRRPFPEPEIEQNEMVLGACPDA